jgi:hypothetical protein
MNETNSAPPVRPFLPRRFVPLVFLLLISGFLSLFVQDFFTRSIFLPFVSFIGYYYRLYQILPQNLVWAFVVMWAGLMALRVLWPRIPPKSRLALPEAPHGRVPQLAALRAQAEKSDYARWELARELEKLALSLLAREYGETAVALQARIAREEIPLPAALQAVFAAGRAIPSYRSFIEARRATGGGLVRQSLAANRPITVLANLDLDAALAALASWEDKP